MDVFRCVFSRGVHFVRFHHDDWRLFFSGMMTGIVLLSMMSVSEASRHLDSVQSETRVSTGRPVREGGSRSLERRTEPEDLRSRVQDILHPAADDAAAAPSSATVPKTVSAEDDSIIGTPLASQQQCVDFLLSVNPAPNITVSPQELVSYYYEEGAREGIRPDVAFAQALKETGFFRYGGTVTPDQNNYCGLGTTSSQVKGAYFGSARLGVRAQIQHLLAYASTRQPNMPVVDPRYRLVRSSYGTRTLGRWGDLNGRWAVPGYTYGQSILSIFRAMLTK